MKTLKSLGTLLLVVMLMIVAVAPLFGESKLVRDEYPNGVLRGEYYLDGLGLMDGPVIVYHPSNKGPDKPGPVALRALYIHGELQYMQLFDLKGRLTATIKPEDVMRN